MENMRTYYRKAWEVIGYTANGSAYCVTCARVLGLIDLADRDPQVWADWAPRSLGDQPRPVFVSDLSDDLMCCDSCSGLIDC